MLCLVYAFVRSKATHYAVELDRTMSAKDTSVCAIDGMTVVTYIMRGIDESVFLRRVLAYRIQ